MRKTHEVANVNNMDRGKTDKRREGMERPNGSMRERERERGGGEGERQQHTCPVQTFKMRSPVASVPSSSAAAPGIILVTKMPSSPSTCWLPWPPAMLKPRPTRQYMYM